MGTSARVSGAPEQPDSESEHREASEYSGAEVDAIKRVSKLNEETDSLATTDTAPVVAARVAVGSERPKHRRSVILFGDDVANVTDGRADEHLSQGEVGGKGEGGGEGGREGVGASRAGGAHGCMAGWSTMSIAPMKTPSLVGSSARQRNSSNSSPP